MQFNKVLYSDHENDASADIVVVDIFKEAKEISKRLQISGVFNAVYFIDEEDHKSEPNGMRKALAIAKDVIFPERLLKQQFRIDCIDFLIHEYDVIVSSVFTHSVACLRTINRGSEYVMMDDGMASYFGDWTKRIRSSFYLDLLKIRNFGKDVSKPVALYVMRKELCKSMLANKIMQLPDFTPDFLKVAFFVFNVADITDYKGSIIWLSHVSNSAEKKEGTYKVSKILANYSKDVVVRKHPREKIDEPYCAFEQDDSLGMWELLLSEISVREKLIVTLASTGAFTPKFLYNYEPWLLFLYKLIPLPNGSQLNDFLLIVNQLKASYQHPEHILEPNSWMEFEECVKTFLAQKF